MAEKVERRDRLRRASQLFVFASLRLFCFKFMARKLACNMKTMFAMAPSVPLGKQRKQSMSAMAMRDDAAMPAGSM